MTRGEMEALDVIRCRLNYTEAMCDLLCEHDQSRLGEALRGIRYLIEDAVLDLDRMIDPIIGTSGAAEAG